MTAESSSELAPAQASNPGGTPAPGFKPESKPGSKRPVAKKARRSSGRPAIELLEEAMDLLQGCGAATLLRYYIGTVPFVVAFLFFWSEMSSGAYADRHLPDATLGMAAAFAWMKCWQSVFCNSLLAATGAQEPLRWSVGRVWRLLIQQTAVQATGLFLLPAAASAGVPFGWTTAFYQNFLLDGSGEAAPLKVLTARSARQARLWQAQNHMALGFISLFGFVVFLNSMVLILTAPALLKMLLGVETAFSRNAFNLLNSTVLMIAVGIAYLVVDPVSKAFYVLRCFHGRSIHSGDDLKVAIRRQRKALNSGSRAAAAAIFGLFVCLGGWRSCAAEPGQGAAGPQTGQPAAVQASRGAVSGQRLNQSIDSVFNRPEYSWRMPRAAAGNSEDDNGIFSKFGRAVAGALEPVWEAAKKAAERFADWIGRMLPKSSGDAPKERSSNLGEEMKVVVYILGGLVVICASVIGWRAWRGRRITPKIAAQPLSAAIDLRSDEVSADQLPEERWMQLAEELTAQGEFRLSVRALYLAGIAHLGLRELLTITRSKSNNDFRRELARRARTRADLISAFGESVGGFERAWYGRADVTLDTVVRYGENLRKIRAC